jgi:hypothetical protein
MPRVPMFGLTKWTKLGIGSFLEVPGCQQESQEVGGEANGAWRKRRVLDGFVEGSCGGELWGALEVVGCLGARALLSRDFLLEAPCSLQTHFHVLSPKHLASAMRRSHVNLKQA